MVLFCNGSKLDKEIDKTEKIIISNLKPTNKCSSKGIGINKEFIFRQFLYYFLFKRISVENIQIN
jgi:hypothetical protein